MISNDLIVIGNGRLAQAILDFAKKERMPNAEIPYRVTHWDKAVATQAIASRPTLVHVGSGRQYHETLEYATKKNGIYIQAATKNEINLTIPTKPSITFIHAPNLSILMIKAIYLTKVLGKLFPDEEKELVESHQSDKTSIAGTALKIAGYLGIRECDIRKIRDQKTQSARLRIINFERHAYHWIKINDKEGSIEITCKIEGLLPYVSGLFKIVDSARKLAAGVYEVENLAEAGLF